MKGKDNERGFIRTERPNFKGISFRDERSAKMRVENKQQSRGLTRCFLPLSYSSLKRSKFLKKKKKVFLKKRKVSKEFLTKFFFKIFERLVYYIDIPRCCDLSNRESCPDTNASQMRQTVPKYV